MAFGISNNVRSRAVRTCTPELFEAVIHSHAVAVVCAELADALEALRRGELTKEEYETKKAELKKRLPIFTPHATFREGEYEVRKSDGSVVKVIECRRTNSTAIPSGLSMYDVDHLPHPHGWWEEKRKVLEAKGLLACIGLVHITPSTEGLRMFFAMPRGMSLEEAQRWMSGVLGDKEYDACVKDLARSSFVVPAEYVLHRDDRVLFTTEDTKGHRGNNFSSVQPDASSPCPTASTENENETQAENENPQCSSVSSVVKSPATEAEEAPTFKGIPYSTIIAEWFRQSGGEPVAGERNDKLHRLAAHLRYITDNDEVLLLRILPRYGLAEEEMKALIHSACSAKFYSLPKKMREVLVRLNIEKEEDREEWEEDETKNRHLPPPMPKKLPKLIDLLISKTPDIYRPAVAHAVFPSLGAHLWRTRFRYIDNVEHEATLMNVLMAGTGAGKDCISMPINRIMADIRARDGENLQREREWKKEINSKGANKDKRQRPEGLVIQEIDADMTNPALVMRMAEADGHFLYTKMNEIDQFDALRGSRRGGQQFQIMCLAFDPGNTYGQTRVGSQSVTEKVCIRFNWNASTTIDKGKLYFRNVLTDGPISRINFCTIPEREIGADMPVYGTYDAAFDEELRPYIENLTRARGLVDCPQAFRLARQLQQENARFAQLSQSRVFENLSFRANVIAYLKACVLYVAHGFKWDKSMEDFVRWSLQYDLWCKMEFFGEDIDNAGKVQKHTKRGPRNLLELLPDKFTTDDAIRLRQNEGMDVKNTRPMLYQWMKRGYIEQKTENSFFKLKFKRKEE